MAYSLAAKPDTHWSGLVPAAEWEVYSEVLARALEREHPFALGGGFAYSYYSRAWRDTKDIDLYIRPQDREAMIQVLSDAGFEDYFDKIPYDRRWIYRGHRNGLITDLIWAMANQRAQVDDAWLRTGPAIELGGFLLRVLPLEELLWSKLYVLQRDRCDWPDMLTLVFARREEINWEHLLARVGDDARLLGGLLSTFSWMCPAHARQLPEWLWSRVGLLPPGGNHDCLGQRERVDLLDSRDWFPPLREAQL